jgi:hypothetical protein
VGRRAPGRGLALDALAPLRTQPGSPSKLSSLPVVVPRGPQSQFGGTEKELGLR